MERGKKVCEVLKGIRKKIAEANEIEYEPQECHHEGDCAGTCPACEAEVRFLEQEVSMRRKLGKAVAVVGISAGLAGLTSSCGLIGNQPTAGMPLENPTIVADSVNNGSDSHVIDDEELAGMPEEEELIFEEETDSTKTDGNSVE